MAGKVKEQKNAEINEEVKKYALKYLTKLRDANKISAKNKKGTIVYPSKSKIFNITTEENMNYTSTSFNNFTISESKPIGPYDEVDIYADIKWDTSELEKDLDVILSIIKITQNDSPVTKGGKEQVSDDNVIILKVYIKYT